MTGILLVTLLALVVALISLDATAVGQVMVSQPLVGGALLGALLGRPAEGLAAGVLFQILTLTDLPVGASVPPDSTLAGLVGTAVFLGAAPPAGWGDGALLGFALLLFFPLARIGRLLEIFVRRVNRSWTALTLSMVREGRYGAAQAASLGGTTLFFAKAFLLSWFTLWTAGAAVSNMPYAPYLAPPLEVVPRVVPFVGLGVFTARRGSLPVAAAAFVLGFFISRGFA